MSGWNRRPIGSAGCGYAAVSVRNGRLAPIWMSTLLPTLAAWLGIPVLRLTGLLGARYFGTAWAEIEAASPRLRQRVRLPLEALAIETARAERIRDRIRRAAGQAGTPLLDAAE